MAVIFDMDGVISDTQKVHARIESEMFAEHGIWIRAAELTRRFSGVSGKDMFAQVFRESGKLCPDVKKLADEKARRFAKCADEFDEIPGTREMIMQLRELGALLAVASASRRSTIDFVLAKLGLEDCFDALVSSQEVARGKPAPDVFLLAAKRLGVDPGSCVVVEDGVSGMEGAKAAGMRCIALVRDTSYDYPADIVVCDLRDVSLDWFLSF